MNAQTSAKKEIFTLHYQFDAPKKLVFNAFSDADALNEWWGPVNSNNSVISLDFKPGGIFHFKMESSKQTTYGRFLFKTIQPYDLLEFTNAFADEKANVIKAPFDIPLPLEIFYSLTFEEQKGKTTIFMTAWPEEHATKEEIEGFVAINEGMKLGFGATFEALSNYLAKNI